VCWGAPDCRLVSGRPSLAVRDGVEVDAPDLWCAPLRACLAVQAEGICARSIEDAVEGDVGDGKELVVFGRVGGDLLWCVLLCFCKLIFFIHDLGVCESACFCAKHNLHAALSAVSPKSPFKVPQRLVDTLISKTSFGVAGFLCGLSLFVEEKRRREELAMYVLPKALESAWLAARGKGWVMKTGDYGEVLVSNNVLFLFVIFFMDEDYSLTAHCGWDGNADGEWKDFWDFFFLLRLVFCRAHIK
jgi:hypothetical protein